MINTKIYPVEVSTTGDSILILGVENRPRYGIFLKPMYEMRRSTLNSDIFICLNWFIRNFIFSCSNIYIVFLFSFYYFVFNVFLLNLAMFSLVSISDIKNFL